MARVSSAVAFGRGSGDAGTVMSAFEEQLRLYDYAFPPALIAQAPAHPRDAARLLVCDRDTGNTEESTFAFLGEFLPKNALLILNRTKVIPARLPLTRVTGGKVAALYLGIHGELFRFLANKKLKPGETLTVAPGKTFIVEASEEKEWLLRPSFALTSLPRLLLTYGQTPLPPYIKESPLTEAQRRREYQTVFAKESGSIAAPTASLHFSKRLLSDLKKRGIETAHVTLHVHLGTFSPLTEEQWAKGALHTEEYVIPPATARLIAEAKREGRPVIAVGTTVVRTLESAADVSGSLTKLSGETSLFIREGYRFRVVDGLITNFHVPKSSLLMLVSAFAGRENVMNWYKKAIEQEFRLFSFGDGMLIL